MKNVQHDLPTNKTHPKSFVTRKWVERPEKFLYTIRKDRNDFQRTDSIILDPKGRVLYVTCSEPQTPLPYAIITRSDRGQVAFFIGVAIFSPKARFSSNTYFTPTHLFQTTTVE